MLRTMEPVVVRFDVTLTDWFNLQEPFSPAGSWTRIRRMFRVCTGH